MTPSPECLPHRTRTCAGRWLTTLLLSAAGLLPVTTILGEDWEQARTLMEKYCLECHGGKEVKGDLDYSLMLENEDMFREDLDTLEAMEFMIAENEMPPPTAKVQPTAAERKALLNWNLKLIDEAAHAIPEDPGVVVMPKLTRSSYNRVLSQLAGQEIEPGNVLAREAPAGAGFTNVGEAHTMEPNQLEKYLMAASEAMSYVRISPVTGFNWSSKPENKLSSPEEARNFYFDRHLAWHDDITKRYAQEPDKWFDDDGVGHAEYWFQVWRWAHRGALEINASEIGELAADSQRPINHVILGKWLRFFENPEKYNPIIEELRTEVVQLPDPNTLKPAEARKKLGELEAWYRQYLVYHTWEPNIELKPNNVFGGGEIKDLQKKGIHRYRFDFSKLEDGKSHEKLYLTLGDALDGNEQDYVILENGYILYGEKLEKKDVKRVPWHEVEGVKWTDMEGRPLDQSNQVQAQFQGGGSLTIKAPAIAVLHLPKDAAGLDMDIVMDDEKYPDASIQHWLDAEIPEMLSTEFGKEPAPPEGFIFRRRAIASDSSQRRVRNYYDNRGDLFDYPRYNPNHPDYYLHTDEELGPYFSKVQTNRTPPDGKNPGRPYTVSIDQFMESLTDEQRAERERRMEEIRFIAQPPHHDLAEMMKVNGIDLIENQRPNDEQLAKLSEEDRQKAREWIEQMNELDHQLMELAKPMVREFTTNAWRRSITPEELDQLMTFYIDARLDGAPYGASVKQSLRATLCSPHFLYRYQVAKNTEDPYPIEARGLADRLAAVFWDGIPDEQLLEKARDGSLEKPEVLAAEARRLLADDRADALGAKFAAEWFDFKYFRNHVDPDPDRFKGYSEEIAYAMEMEATHFFSYMLRNNRPLTDLYQAPYTFANEKLAGFYGIDGVNSEEFVKVDLPEQRRGGVLTLGSFLTKTSLPLRTSAVVRGTWIIEKVLGEHLPDPPPNVPQLSDDETNEAGLSVAEQLARHRDDPACMGCHQKIDPLGIALENFDPVGQWRDEFIDGSPVEATDTTVDGAKLTGLQDLTGYLDSRREEIFKKFSRMFTAYALGRDLQPSDRPLIEKMVEAIEKNDYQFAPAVEVLVTSKQFRYRRDSLDYAMNE